MEEQGLKKTLRNIFGAADFDQLGKSKIHKPQYFSMAGTRSDELVSLAEEALASKGMVYAKKNSNRQYVCWAVIKKVYDGIINKKKAYHFEASYIGTAEGFEEMYESFEEDVKRVINGQMLLYNNIKSFHINGEVLLPDRDKVIGEENTNKRICFGLMMGFAFGLAFNNWAIGALYFVLFANIGKNNISSAKSKESDEQGKTGSDRKE